MWDMMAVCNQCKWLIFYVCTRNCFCLYALFTSPGEIVHACTCNRLFLFDHGRGKGKKIDAIAKRTTYFQKQGKKQTLA